MCLLHCKGTEQEVKRGGLTLSIRLQLSMVFIVIHGLSLVRMERGRMRNKHCIGVRNLLN